MRQYLKEHVCGTYYPTVTSFRSRKQPASAGSERKQSSKNAFVALQRMRLQNALLFEPQHMYVCMYLCGLTPVAFYVFLF